jgi:hypothetical protein
MKRAQSRLVLDAEFEWKGKTVMVASFQDDENILIACGKGRRFRIGIKEFRKEMGHRKRKKDEPKKIINKIKELTLDGVVCLDCKEIDPFTPDYGKCDDCGHEYAVLTFRKECPNCGSFDFEYYCNKCGKANTLAMKTFIDLFFRYIATTKDQEEWIEKLKEWYKEELANG